MIHRNSKSEPAEMSYFRLNLLSYLWDSHPKLANNHSFVSGRGDMAAEAYSEAIKNGSDHIQAAEIANKILFKGLLFSPYNLIIEILRNEFSVEIPEDGIREKAGELMPECRDILSAYNLNDDFSESAEYELLYTKLVGTILTLLENELQ